MALLKAERVGPFYSDRGGCPHDQAEVCYRCASLLIQYAQLKSLEEQAYWTQIGVILGAVALLVVCTDKLGST